MKNFAWTLIALIAGLAGVLLMLPEPGREAPDPAPTAERTLITGARVFDGEEFIDDATLVIADGRVEALGSDLAVDDGAEIFDASGKTIDADGGDNHRAPVEDRGTAAAPAEPIDLLTQPERWMAAADDYLGGQSRSSIDWLEAQSSSTLAVDADVESGFAFPYAGAMWNTTAIPMQPADHAGLRRLVIEIDGPGSGYQVMFFSGEAPGAQPVRVPLSPGQQTVIELGDLDGFDRSTLRAIGVFATGQSDPRQFTLTRARLE